MALVGTAPQRVPRTTPQLLLCPSFRAAAATTTATPPAATTTTAPTTVLLYPRSATTAPRAPPATVAASLLQCSSQTTTATSTTATTLTATTTAPACRAPLSCLSRRGRRHPACHRTCPDLLQTLAVHTTLDRLLSSETTTQALRSRPQPNAPRQRGAKSRDAPSSRLGEGWPGRAHCT